WQNEWELVFTTPIGTPVNQSNIRNRHFYDLLDAAGLPRMRFHDLRHTCATLMLQAGVQPKVVQETLGHSTIAMTIDLYSHVMPSIQKEAATRMNDLLTAASAK
ncbi:MAG: tyrosine-type recombinase/integrase, partial [Thermaerobacterales bacterium]